MVRVSEHFLAAAAAIVATLAMLAMTTSQRAATFAWDAPAMDRPLAPWETPVAHVLKIGPVPGLPTNIFVAGGMETNVVVDLRRRQYVTMTTIYADGSESAATAPLMVDTVGKVWLEESTNLVDWTGLSCFPMDTNATGRSYRVRLEQ